MRSRGTRSAKYLGVCVIIPPQILRVLLFHAAGTNAMYRAHPLERAFRDIHVAVQHNAAFPAHFESAGKVLLGLRPSDMGW